GSDEADQPSFQGGFVAEGEVEASVFPGSAVHQITAFGLLYGGHAPSVTAAVGFDHDISMVSEKGEGLLGPFPSLGVRQVGPERSVAGQDFMGVPFSDQSPAEQLDVGILVQSHDKGFVFPVLA